MSQGAEVLVALKVTLLAHLPSFQWGFILSCIQRRFRLPVENTQKPTKCFLQN